MGFVFEPGRDMGFVFEPGRDMGFVFEPGRDMGFVFEPERDIGFVFEPERKNSSWGCSEIFALRQAGMPQTFERGFEAEQSSMKRGKFYHGLAIGQRGAAHGAAHVLC
eukprot:Selendium_serpulae@DN11957_c0_g1_i1.p2